MLLEFHLSFNAPLVPYGTLLIVNVAVLPAPVVISTALDVYDVPSCAVKDDAVPTFVVTVIVIL